MFLFFSSTLFLEKYPPYNPHALLQTQSIILYYNIKIVQKQPFFLSFDKFFLQMPLKWFISCTRPSAIQISNMLFFSKVLKPTAEGAEIHRDNARFRFFSSAILGALGGSDVFACDQRPRQVAPASLAAACPERSQ
ncbi:hypothetical protein JW998_15725 [candidate division KSB1 bacterium]|nr:hypothetical protein [candidate division KSB1 bacterium]